MRRTVLITGASRGIGMAMAEIFARRGHIVYANYNTTKATLPPLAEALARAGHTLVPVPGDVSCAADVERIVDETGGVDILINNAGIAQFCPFSDMTDSDWDKMIDTNLRSVYLCTRRAVPHMIKNKWGRIINVSSVWGVTGGSCEAHYSAAKAGMIGFTKALAKELGPSGITVNCLAPGAILTDMNSALAADEVRALEEETPVGRLGRAEEVASAALFLAESDFVTGEVININGGFWI